MRLKKVEKGQKLIHKVIRGASRLSGKRLPDVVRALLYRPELFGEACNSCMEEALRGESDWTIGERELFAAYVAHVNQCEF